MTLSPGIYLPDAKGVPGQRYVMFSTQHHHEIMLFDESVRTADGERFVGTWESPSLGRQDHGRVWTISMLTLFYESKDDSSVRVSVSRDGGRSFLDFRDMHVENTFGEVRSKTLNFNVTGEDVRFRIQFNTDNLVKIAGYRARLIPRGLAYYG